MCRTTGAEYHCARVIKRASEGIHSGFGTLGRSYEKSKTVASQIFKVLKYCSVNLW